MINSYTKDFNDLKSFLNQDNSVLDELKTKIGENFLEENDISCIEEMIELIQECADDYKESREDGDYIYCSYFLKTKNYIFEVYSSSYIKDRCICDPKFNDSIYVIDRNLKKIGDDIEKNKKLSKNETNWLEFFGNKSVDELKAELLKYKFPTKIN